MCAVDAPDAYLKQILVRTCIDRARKRKAQEIITDVVPDLGTTDDTNDEKWAVRAALAKVPVSQREILILRFYADMSVVETAAALGCSTGKAKVRGDGATNRAQPDADRAPTLRNRTALA